MKKQSIIMVLLYFALLFVSCSRQEQETIGKTKDESIECKELQSIDLEKNGVSVIEYMDEDVNEVIYFDNNKLVYFVDKESSNPDTSNCEVYLYDKSTGDNKFIIEVSDVNASKGDICVLGKKVYYAFFRMTDVAAYNCLMELDLEKKTAQLIPIENATMLFVDIAVTDNHVFILKRNEVDSRRTDYIVERLDGQELKEISSVTYRAGKSEKDADEGEYYLDFVGEEDYLYLFRGGVGREDYSFLCMTENGEIKENCKIDLQDDLKLEMEDFTSLDGEEEEDSDLPWEILKNGDYYIINTLNNRNFLFRKEGNKFVKIHVPKQLGNKELTYRSKIVTVFGERRYIFFKEIENDSLYVFDTKTETFGRIDVKADGEIGEVMRNMDKQFFFSVTGKDGTDDYILYNEKDVLQEKK